MLTDEMFYSTKAYSNQFVKLCEPLTQYLKLTNPTYINIDKNGGFSSIYSDFKWIEGYIDGEHYKTDLHLVHPSNMHEGFCILAVYDNYKYREYNDVMLYNCNNACSYGFTYVSKKNENNFTAFCFTTQKNKIINEILNQAAIVKHFIKKLDEQIQSLFPNLPESKVDLVKLKGESFFKQRGIVFRK